MGSQVLAKAALNELAEAIGGPKERTGRGIMVCCPAHQDRSPSLHLSVGGDGRLLVKCFSGCGQAEVIAALRGRGLWPGAATDEGYRQRRPTPAPPPTGDEAERRAAALRIWRQCRPASGSPVETYLRSRGIILLPPPSIRFHPSLLHRPSGRQLPAMVAGVQALDGRVTAVHRTWLRDDGGGKADVKRPKMMLGSVAPGAVRLARAGTELHVGEGLETCLAAMQATGQSTWAALSASGLETLVLPETTREVLVLADSDAAGEQAAQAAARRWVRLGLRVRIARPPAGADFNDVLVAASA